MKKINLILSFILLASFYQICFFHCSLEKHPSTENPQKISHSSKIDWYANDGLQIISPDNGEVIRGSIVIRWIFTYPYSLGESIECQIYYSKNLGLDWIQLGFDNYETFFEWNTDEYEEYGTDFKIKITAFSKDWVGGLYTVSENSFIIDNRVETFGSFSNYFMIIIPVVIITLGSITGLIVSRSRLQKHYSAELSKINQTDKIKTLKHKVVVGIDNIKYDHSWSPENTLASEIVISSVNDSVIQFFSSTFQNELKSAIKGRTIIVLIELAYQNPSETNPLKIAEKVGIPLSTFSKEIKKLVDLNYIENHISNQVLLDARMRNYRITVKGYEFLLILNDILKRTITQIQKRNDIFSS